MIGPPVLVVAEIDGAGPTANSLELLTVARNLATGSGRVVVACLGTRIGEGVGSELAAHGADAVVMVDDPIFTPFQADAWVHELAAIATELKPGTILVPHSLAGVEVAPRLAFRLDTAVATGCVGLDLVDGDARWTRSCYGGNAREVVSIHTTPVIATIAARAFDPLPANQAASVAIDRRPATVDPGNVRARVIAKSAAMTTGVRLENAKVVVSGGHGLGGAAGFEQVRTLAALLGGAAGATRVACDLGWCPRAWQIGQSGKTVVPDLYFALGISGAAQHMAGCGNAGAIVAVNTDPDAEIFKSARFGIVADCNEFLAALIEEIRKVRP